MTYNNLQTTEHCSKHFLYSLRCSVSKVDPEGKRPLEELGTWAIIYKSTDKSNFAYSFKHSNSTCANFIRIASSFDGGEFSLIEKLALCQSVSSLFHISPAIETDSRVKKHCK